MVEKHLAISFQSSKDALEFLEYLKKHISDENLVVTIRGNRLKISINAAKADAESLLQKIKAKMSEWKASRQIEKGFHKVPLGYVLSMASMRISIPLNAFIDALNLKGYKSELKGKYVLTKLETGKLIEELERFSEHYSQAIYLDAYPIVKRIAAILMFVKKIGIEEVLEFLRKKNIIDSDEQGRARLRVNYRDALKILENEVRG